MPIAARARERATRAIAFPGFVTGDVMSNEPSCPRYSIGRRSLQAIDDPHFHRCARRFELQPLLLLQRGEDGSAALIGRARRAEQQLPVVGALQPCAIDNGTLDEARE